MSGWIITHGSSYYGPFSNKNHAAVWGERMFGPYTGSGWRIEELWNPKHVEK